MKGDNSRSLSHKLTVIKMFIELRRMDTMRTLKGTDDMRKYQAEVRAEEYNHYNECIKSI